MGIHNSSYLSTEWRVANHINMKAFMTICALLAGSATADPQNVGLLQTGTPLIQYSLPSPSLNGIRYTKYQMDQPTVVPMYTLGYPSLIKREAEPESPYAYGSRVVNTEDGSKYEFDVQVDKNGDGKSHQRVEQQDTRPVPIDNYLMNQRMIEQNRRDRMRMDQMSQQVMEANLQDLRQTDLKEQSRLDQQRLPYLQNQMDQRMRSQGHQNQMDQRIRSQDHQDQMEQRSRMNQDQMPQHQMAQNHMVQNQMTQKQMAQNQMAQNQMAQNQMAQNQMDQNRMSQMLGNQDQMDTGMYRMDSNRMRVNKMRDNVNRMQSNRRMIKREAGPSFAYTVSTGHPSEQSRHMMQVIKYQMPLVDSIPLPSLHQVHPDGGLSYRMIPSLMSYSLMPVNMITGSRVDVQQDGQGYGFRTMA